MLAYFQSLLTKQERVRMGKAPKYPAGSRQAELARLRGLHALGLLDDDDLAVGSKRLEEAAGEGAGHARPKRRRTAV